MAKLRVVFAYRAIQKARGSKIMRSDQLCAMAQLHLGHLYDFEQVQLHGAGKPRQQRRMVEHLRGAIVIFLKGSARNFDADGIDALRNAVRGICVDHLDGPVDGRLLPFVDVHIAASRAGEAALRHVLGGGMSGALWPGATVVHLTHHADPRLQPRVHDQVQMTAAYFGMPENTAIPTGIVEHVPVVDQNTDIGDMLAAMTQTHLHYAVRSRARLTLGGQRIFKPFTKGFNAARAGAVVLADRGADDALIYLGEDYPFLARSTRAEDIVETFQAAKDAFGGPDWARALDRMAYLRRCSATDHVMAELHDILVRFD